MSNQSRLGRKKRNQIAATDVGRFLKQFSLSFKDPLTGNPAMASALYNLGTILMESKLAPVEIAAKKFVEQGGFDFDDGIDFGRLSTREVQNALNNANLTRSHLIILGTERFGIARSRLEKLPREEIINLITSASQHEESLDIISEEARKGGQSRSS